MSRTVRIVNSAGRDSRIRRKAALRLVARGVARWLDIGTIAMIENDHRVRSGMTSAARSSEYDRAAHSGLADIDAIRHVPVVGPIDRLLTERRRRLAA